MGMIREFRKLLRKRGSRKKKKVSTEDRLAALYGVTRDIEDPRRPSRQLMRDGRHGMLRLSSVVQGSRSSRSSDSEEVDSSDEDVPYGTRDLVARDLLEGKGSKRVLEKVIEERLNKLSDRQRQEELQLKKTAMEQIVNAQSLKHFKKILDINVNEDWMAREISGNIYRMSAFGAFTYERYMELLAHGDWIGAFKLGLVHIGVAVIGIIQMVGAPGQFLTTAKGWGIDPDEAIHFSMFNSTMHQKVFPIEYNKYWTTKLFASLFIVTFIINGLFVTIQEWESWNQLNRIRFILQRVGNEINIKGYWMWVGCFVNCWVILWCTLDVWLVASSATTLKDVLFDSLGLLFLFNLDDIGGDLGFFADEEWKGAELAWMYDNLEEYLSDKDKEPIPISGKYSSRSLASNGDDEEEFLTWEFLKNHHSWFATPVYGVTCFLLIIALPTILGLHFSLPIITMTGTGDD